MIEKMKRWDSKTFQAGDRFINKCGDVCEITWTKDSGAYSYKVIAKSDAPRVIMQAIAYETNARK